MGGNRMKKCIECGKPKKPGDALMCSDCHNRLAAPKDKNKFRSAYGLTANDVRKLKPMQLYSFIVPGMKQDAAICIQQGATPKQLEVIRAQVNELLSALSIAYKNNIKFNQL